MRKKKSLGALPIILKLLILPMQLFEVLLICSKTEELLLFLGLNEYRLPVFKESPRCSCALTVKCRLLLP